MVFTSFVGIIFLGLDFHYYDEGSGRFRTSVAQESARTIADLAGNPSPHPWRKSPEKESRKNPLRRACRVSSRCGDVRTRIRIRLRWLKLWGSGYQKGLRLSGDTGEVKARQNGNIVASLLLAF
jgi:hypothetical protein